MVRKSGVAATFDNSGRPKPTLVVFNQSSQEPTRGAPTRPNSIQQGNSGCPISRAFCEKWGLFFSHRSQATTPRNTKAPVVSRRSFTPLVMPTRPSPPHPQSQSSTADTAARSATAPAAAPPGSCSRAPVAALPESFRLPTAPASCPPAENDFPHPRLSQDANPDEYPSPQSSFLSPARTPVQ